jgi:hypothetical protein
MNSSKAKIFVKDWQEGIHLAMTENPQMPEPPKRKAKGKVVLRKRKLQ